ncbi:MAG: MmcB family DNA repair protein, partial [Hyphomicrobiaceae bacterium]
IIEGHSFCGSISGTGSIYQLCSTSTTNDISTRQGNAMTDHNAERQSPTEDGRQSPTAKAIARGTMRLLYSLGFASLTELTLPSGRRADIVGVSEKGAIWIVEIKSGIEDFRADRKWMTYSEYCDCFFFAVEEGFPQQVLPNDVGLIVADKYGADIVRSASATHLAAARRKVITIRFARTAASRMQALTDPDAGAEATRRFS